MMKLVGPLTWVLRYDRWLLWVGIPLLSVLMHWWVWNRDLTGPHVWRQTQTQQTIDCFVEEDFCILNPRRLERGNGDGIERMEFPLFQWLVAAMAKIFGQSVFLSRLCTFLASLAAMGAIHYLLLGLTQDRLTALLGSFLFALAPVIYYFGVSPLPDMLALALALWGAALLKRLDRQFLLGPGLGGIVLIGLATLVKLPYIMFYAFPACWGLHASITSRNWRAGTFAALAMGLSILPAFFWYSAVIPTWSNNLVVKGNFSDGLDYGQAMIIWKDHLTQMIPRTLMSVAAVPLFLLGVGLQLRKSAPKYSHAAHRWMLLGFGATFLLYYGYEFMLINLYHDYYMLPLVLLLLIPQAIGASWLLQQSRWWLAAVALLLLLAVPYMTHRRITAKWRPEYSEFNPDFAIHHAALRKAVPDDALVAAGPDISNNIFLYYIHKRGWTWSPEQPFDAAILSQWRRDGAQYLYCDDRTYDSPPEIQALLGPPIGTFGSVKVYPLK